MARQAARVGLSKPLPDASDSNGTEKNALLSKRAR